MEAQRTDSFATRALSTRPAPRLVGDSAAVERVRADIARFAQLPAPVLITGETGVGKELVAHAVHDVSRRAGTFVAVNAAALPATLAATELFGHERGAFTGATQRRRGAFELAHAGTLFIDEVGELALDLQAWLLRVVESGRVTRLGAEVSVPVDVRVVAATNMDLAAAVRAGRFRADLYWRLAVLPIAVPPLRDRREDLPVLVESLLAELALEARHLDASALQASSLHDWPGNIRELRSVLLRAAAATGAATLDAADIVRAIGERPFAEALSTREPCVRSALVAARGNVTAAARLVGLPRSTFRDRLRGAVGSYAHEPRRPGE